MLQDGFSKNEAFGLGGIFCKSTLSRIDPDEAPRVSIISAFLLIVQFGATGDRYVALVSVQLLTSLM